MMVGERSYGGSTLVHVPPWSFTADDPNSFNLKALQLHLPSNSEDAVGDDNRDDDDSLPVDAHSCDHFRMYEFKVRKCARARSHDWTDCPFAHPGEKARRRDPTKFHYSGSACPDFRKGNCPRGDSCEFAHGVFECWLHPARYRTQPCKDGMNCKRRVCFFAHSPDQLRVVGESSYDLSPRRLAAVMSESPPMSPSVNEMVASLRRLHLNKVNSMPSPSSWLQGGGSNSPRLKVTRPGYFSLPTTPTRPGFGYFEEEEEPMMMERVESGRDLRAKMFEKLSKENPLDRGDAWVCHLLLHLPKVASSPPLGACRHRHTLTLKLPATIFTAPVSPSSMSPTSLFAPSQLPMFAAATSLSTNQLPPGDSAVPLALSQRRFVERRQRGRGRRWLIRVEDKLC
ncbi:hypothetical protein BUALT_Bualt16G0058100 [Buddleja alternifolia]|uniref:C3H1-type domain-containing protein n=1 Tax=Buddleja alternifolia TaxID=168488 RepID=A0AAV6W759_9LAMI|nr:hypothetical protein BUALT_Bualt16G0058000 [Buddleja alternifolia]KAG8367301.1 hypothetical protein BUALT_Bualt16G0058100 [Buddleja alternifolia]